ncbi:auxin efflux carrier [Bhargavaea cecembensis]|uniref:Auxin efflux carrier n=1 Tax=Bhargavaea cecembensis TaxID=394098 RepID=A0A163GJ24_9BACL|nr:AEC family transporter [Bhargavaea cecembensis]KZE40316.1 auxin efflux carrier [Bhargavaea cecembensis]
MKKGGGDLSASAFILTMIPLYLMAVIGFIVRKMNILSNHANSVITQLMLYVTLPALILYSLNTTFSIELLVDFTWLVSMSVFVMTVSIIAGAWLRKRAALPDGQKSVYESLIVFGNQGFIGFAVIYMLMAEQGVVYLTLFNLFYLVLIWSYGIYLFTRHDVSVSWRVLFLNPGILATLVGLAMLFLPFSWPGMLLRTFEDIGTMTVPLSMILIGSLLADTSMNDFRYYSRNVYLWTASSMKLLVLPMTLLIFLLFRVPEHLLLIAVLTAGMPSATTTTLYAQKFGADAVFASYGVIYSTILCMFTIPLLYSLLQWLL